MNQTDILKNIAKWPVLAPAGWDMYDSFRDVLGLAGYEISHLCSLNILKLYFFLDMYYICGCVRAIPTYGVYQLYDICMTYYYNYYFKIWKFHKKIWIFNPWCMREGYILCLYFENKVLYLCGFCWKRFVQNFWQHLLITSAFFAPWQALDGQKSDAFFFSTRLVCRSSDRSYYSTDSSLVLVLSTMLIALNFRVY